MILETWMITPGRFHSNGQSACLLVHLSPVSNFSSVWRSCFSIALMCWCVLPPIHFLSCPLQLRVYWLNLHGVVFPVSLPHSVSLLPKLFRSLCSLSVNCLWGFNKIFCFVAVLIVSEIVSISSSHQLSPYSGSFPFEVPLSAAAKTWSPYWMFFF